MLRELCTTFETAYHNQYQRGLHCQSVLLAYAMTLQCVIERKSDENARFGHFLRYFTEKASARRLSTLRELCTTFKTAYHNQYQRSLHSQSVLLAYTGTLQCVIERKSDENEHFVHFLRYFTGKASARRLRMLRELCTTFETAYHNQYQRGSHSQSVLLAYTMTLQCVIE